ncbi:MAG: hypothetical protein IPJ65_34555 [Archangiaceae bacterium]|nr:hypothetical protein [Archangiaceae bacterium]
MAVKQAFPNFGARKISDSLRRFEALGVSATQVRRILHEEGLLPDKPPELPKMPPPERRFERAEPDQLWQSDIFTFLLRRHQRVYVTAFVDVHSALRRRACAVAPPEGQPHLRGRWSGHRELWHAARSADRPGPSVRHGVARRPSRCCSSSRHFAT